MPTIEVRVLGSVEVLAAGHTVPLDAPKRRALVTLLALNANRVVSTGEIMAALWGDSPPASARAQVQSLVHGVRTRLAEATGSAAMLETRSPGYLLRLGAGELDLLTFEHRVAKARTAVAEGRGGDAIAQFRQAIELWRGPALGGIDAPFAARHVDRLEDERVCVHEERIELELSRGRHMALTAELSLLVAEHPYRERLRAQLMLALYRCGRQAEALAAYRHGRALLVEQLGIEPGSHLRELEQRILTSDPALDLVDALRTTPDRPAAVPDAPLQERRAGGTNPPGLVRVAAGVLAVIGLLAIAVSLFMTGDDDATSPPAAAQRFSGPVWVASPPVRVPAGFFGVTINSSSGSMPTFRVDAVRLWDSRTRWSNIQPRRGVFDWNILDRLVAGAREAGLPVLYTMGATPGWASPDGPPTAYDDGSRTTPPRSMADWRTFVRAVVKRYRYRIEAYELWNLANSPRYYSGGIAALVEMTRQREPDHPGRRSARDGRLSVHGRTVGAADARFRAALRGRRRL